MNPPEPDPPQAEIKMVPNEAGVLVPEDKLPPKCHHQEVLQRYHLTINHPIQYVCQEEGCKKKVLLRIVSYQAVVLTPEELTEFEKVMEAQQRAFLARRQKMQKMGLVLPGQDLPSQQQKGPR